MRQIKFKAQRLSDNKWIYGYYFTNQEEPWNDGLYYGKHFIKSINNGIDFRVIPETVHEFTGELDSNRVEIYEGDKVYIWGGEKDGGYYELMMDGVIEFKYGQFIVRGISGTYFSFGEFDHIEVRNN